VTLAAHDRVDQLVAIVDVNGLGQSGSTMLEWGVDAYRRLAVREIRAAAQLGSSSSVTGLGGWRSLKPRRIAPRQRNPSRGNSPIRGIM